MVNGVNADAALASPIWACYTAPMTYNAILIIECLVEDFGWDAVMDELMKEVATASDERPTCTFLRGTHLTVFAGGSILTVRISPKGSTTALPGLVPLISASPF